MYGPYAMANALHRLKMVLLLSDCCQLLKLWTFSSSDISVIEYSELLALIFLLRIRSHERLNELIPVWDFKPTWKQVLFEMKFYFSSISKRPDILMNISFQIMFACILSSEIKFHFCQNDRYEIQTRNEFQTHRHIKRHNQRVCAYSFHFR